MSKRESQQWDRPSRRGWLNLLTSRATSTPDEFALGLTRFLPTAKDLLSLCLACPRFAAKMIAGRGGAEAAAVTVSAGDAVDGGGGGAAVGCGSLWVAGCSEQERGWVPLRAPEKLAGSDARGGVASGAAGVRSGAHRRHAV